MGKDKKFGRRVIMSVLGVLVCGMSVGLFKRAMLGVDPYQSLMAGLNAVIPISFGTLYVIMTGLLLLVALIFDRHKIGLATIINMTLLGYVADYTRLFLGKTVPGGGPSWQSGASSCRGGGHVLCLCLLLYGGSGGFYLRCHSPHHFPEAG